MIRIDSIKRRYNDFFLNISFSVGDGEIVSLLGSSGSGKTTSLRIIAGFEQAQEGHILIDRTKIDHLPPQKRNIGFVFQDYTLFPHLNVLENTAYGLRAQGIPVSQRKDRARQLLELTGLSGYEHRSPETLSGGEKQRVALARALAPKPAALLLDEPFSAVDSERREELRRYIRHIRDAVGIPIIFVTHNQSEALSMSDRIVLLKDGQIVEQGRPEQLYSTPQTSYAARFLGRANLVPMDRLPNPIRTRLLEDDAPANKPENSATGTENARLVLIRPENMVIQTAPGTQNPPEELTGTITTALYHGAHYEYELETSLGPLFATSQQCYRPGTPIRLTIDRASILPA